MNRTIAAVLLVAVLAIGGGLIAVTAYQAGLGTAVTSAVAEGGNVVTTVPVYGYGYGWHPGGFGLGFFGFIGTLLFLFLLIGLLRAVFFRGGSGHGWGPGGGPGSWGPGRAWWETRGREGFDDWHRRAHEGDSSSEPPASNTTSKPA